MEQPGANDYNEIKVELIHNAIKKHNGLNNLIVNPKFKSFLDSFVYEEIAGKKYIVFYYDFRQFCDYENRVTDDWTGSVGKEITI